MGANRLSRQMILHVTNCLKRFSGLDGFLKRTFVVLMLRGVLIINSGTREIASKCVLFIRLL